MTITIEYVFNFGDGLCAVLILVSLFSLFAYLSKIAKEGE
jgi:hypothetical protein